MDIVVVSNWMWKFLMFDFALNEEKFSQHKNGKNKLIHVFKILIFTIHLVNMLLFAVIYGSWMFEKPFNAGHFIQGFSSVSVFSFAILKNLNIMLQRDKIKKIFSQIIKTFTNEDRKKFKIDEKLRTFLLYRRLCLVTLWILVAVAAVLALLHVFKGDGSFPLEFMFINFYAQILCMSWVQVANFTFLISNVVTDLFQYGLITTLSIELYVLAQDFASLEETVHQKQENIPELSTATSQNSKPAEVQEITIDDIKPLIDRHNQLLEVRNLIWNVFGLFFNIRFVQSSILLCLTAFQITITEDLPYFYITILMSYTLNIFFQCYFGQMLSDAGRSIEDSIQHCGWEKIEDIKVKKCLLQVLIRAQNPISFEILKLSEVSLEQFTVVVSSAYSYYNFCSQVYN